MILQVRFSSIQTPKNFIEDSRSTLFDSILYSDSEAAAEYYLFFDDLWKKEYLVFLTFSGNLLALNKLLTFVSSLFNSSNQMLKTHRQISKKRCFEKHCSCDKVFQFSAL